MNLKEIEQEISKLKTEIEIDKNELENVPEDLCLSLKWFNLKREPVTWIRTKVGWFNWKWYHRQTSNTYR